MKRCISIVILLLLLLFIALAGAVWKMQRYAVSPLLISQPTLFTLPAGTGSTMLVSQLAAQKIIRQPGWLLWLLRTHRQYAQFKAGTYRLTPGMSVRDLLLLLESGKEAQFPLRLVEGSQLRDILRQLRDAPYLQHTLSQSDAVGSLASLLKVPQSQLEGYFWPDTWLYTAGTSDVAILRRAWQRMQQELTQAWQHRAADLPYRDPQQLLTMASIVEKETARSDERALVASVFINRLRQGMRLQTDPTVIYGMGSRYQGNLRREDLQTATPYNTYLINGLPPTPIAVPGKASLQAAAHPATSDYLYFVANGKGGHTFSKNLAQHNAAVRQYLKILRRSPASVSSAADNGEDGGDK